MLMHPNTDLPLVFQLYPCAQVKASGVSFAPRFGRFFLAENSHHWVPPLRLTVQTFSVSTHTDSVCVQCVCVLYVWQLRQTDLQTYRNSCGFSPLLFTPVSCLCIMKWRHINWNNPIILLMLKHLNLSHLYTQSVSGLSFYRLCVHSCSICPTPKVKCIWVQYTACTSGNTFHVAARWDKMQEKMQI